MHSQAVVLEMIGDLPEADAKPPTSVLFVCKLNPVTSEVCVGWFPQYSKKDLIF